MLNSCLQISGGLPRNSPVADDGYLQQNPPSGNFSDLWIVLSSITAYLYFLANTRQYAFSGRPVGFALAWRGDVRGSKRQEKASTPRFKPASTRAVHSIPIDATKLAFSLMLGGEAQLRCNPHHKHHLATRSRCDDLPTSCGGEIQSCGLKLGRITARNMCI